MVVVVAVCGLQRPISSVADFSASSNVKYFRRDPILKSLSEFRFVPSAHLKELRLHRKSVLSPLKKIVTDVANL
jgi:hypothetical protein